MNVAAERADRGWHNWIANEHIRTRYGCSGRGLISIVFCYKSKFENRYE